MTVFFCDPTCLFLSNCSADCAATSLSLAAARCFAVEEDVCVTGKPEDSDDGPNEVADVPAPFVDERGGRLDDDDDDDDGC